MYNMIKRMKISDAEDAAGQIKEIAKYKPISGKLKDHFGWKLLDGNVSNTGNVYCIHCDTSFVFHGSNTSLMYQLQKKHQILYKKSEFHCSVDTPSLMNQVKLSKFGFKFNREVSGALLNDITTALAKWIARNGRPISIVEDDGLLQLMRISLQNNDFNLPSRRTIDEYLTNIYEVKREKLKEEIKNTMAIAITSDFWTSLGNESYCALTGHWVSDKWQLQSVILECVNYSKRHYSENVSDLYKELSMDWNITEKIQTFVTDNARNMVSAVSKTGLPHILCMAHILQLSIRHGFQISDGEILFTKCRKLIGHFKHSSVNTAELKNCNESPLCKLQQDVTTRWNSTCTMLWSLIQAKKAIMTYLSQDSKHTNLTLSDMDWEKVHKYFDILDLFRQATVLLGGDKYVTSSCILPLISSLKKHLVPNEDDPGYITKFKTATINNFMERVSNLTSIELLQIATALDPRYKNLKCLSKELKENTWKIIHAKMMLYITDGHEKKIENNKHFSKQIKLIDSDSDSEENVENNMDELHRYQCEKRIPESADPLQWWKLNECRYPILSLLSKRVLCIPATSVSCERIFSSAGYIVSKTRSSLEPNSVNLLVCLRNWLSNEL